MTELIAIENSEPTSFNGLQIERSVDQVIAQSRNIAQAALSAIKQNGWAQNFGGKDHITFEGLSFIATITGISTRVCETRPIEINGVTVGYEAVAEAFHIRSGTILSRAESMCTREEEQWDTRAKYDWQGTPGARKKVKVGDVNVPLFQLRSMAQTRAMGKALRTQFGWILAMAGYAPRPAEEGTAEWPEEEQPRSAAPQQPQRKAAESADGKISPKQASRIWALAHAANKDRDEVVRILKTYGFETPQDVTPDKYELICAEIQKGDAQ